MGCRFTWPWYCFVKEFLIAYHDFFSPWFYTWYINFIFKNKLLCTQGRCYIHCSATRQPMTVVCHHTPQRTRFMSIAGPPERIGTWRSGPNQFWTDKLVLLIIFRRADYPRQLLSHSDGPDVNWWTENTTTPQLLLSCLESYFFFHSSKLFHGQKGRWKGRWKIKICSVWNDE